MGSPEQTGTVNMIPTTRKLGGIMGRLQCKTAAYSDYRGLRPQPKKQKEIPTRNFLQKSEEVTDKDPIRHRLTTASSRGRKKRAAADAGSQAFAIVIEDR
jgi:hypothetical protein